jgi:hypothetical protein
MPSHEKRRISNVRRNVARAHYAKQRDDSELDRWMSESGFGPPLGLAQLAGSLKRLRQFEQKLARKFE